MKRALCLAAVLLALGPVAFAWAILWADGQREDVVVTENTLFGDLKAAEGARVRMVSQWQGRLVWDTVYTVGSGETESDFSFYAEAKSWRQRGVDEFLTYTSTHWGMTHVSGARSVPFDPDGYPLSEMVRKVADSTRPGETYTEVLRMKDYYDYYPLEIYVDYTDGGGRSVYYHGDGDTMADLFRIPVPEWVTLEITVEKDEEGEAVNVQCEDREGEALIDVHAFGRDGCYYAYYMEGITSGEVMQPGEDYGIYYFPYIEEKYKTNRTIDPLQRRKACSLQPGMKFVEMVLEEDLGELYLVTKEGDEYHLNVYEIAQEALVPVQKLAVRSVTGEAGEESNPYWSQMSVRGEGVLMVWQDGSFVFAERQDGGLFVRCQGQHPSIRNSDGSDLTFPSEHAWAFDGERLALVSYEDWGSVSVNLAVYTDDALVYYGLCQSSSDVGRQQGDYAFLITPPGTTGNLYGPSVPGTLTRRPGSADAREILGVGW